MATVQSNTGAAGASAHRLQPDATKPAAGDPGGSRVGSHGGPPLAVVPAIACSIDEIRQRLGVVVGQDRVAEVAKRTGFNPETVRRYLRTDCSIPADFVAAVAASYGVDPASIMLLHPASEHEAMGFDWDASKMADAAVKAVLPALRAWLMNAKQDAARGVSEAEDDQISRHTVQTLTNGVDGPRMAERRHA